MVLDEPAVHIDHYAMRCAERHMNKIRDILRWRTPEWVTSAILGLFMIGVLTLEGMASGVYVEMYRDFGIDNCWPQRIHKFIHWQWTLPLGVILATALVWKARIVSVRWNRAVDLVTCLAVFGVLAGWMWSALCWRIQR